jgi:hypothetical protein
MTINQLFISKPPIELLQSLILGFGLKNFNDKKEFCYLDMDRLNTLQVFHNLEKELSKYYLPCKKKNYFNDIKILTNKEAITILKQLLKIYDYDLNSREKFIKGTKYSIYKLITKQDKIFNLHKKKNKEITIIFD